ncbi:hypothetical protein PoB_005064000 [Plakobranchus ocellatus]|uniref:Uncharacterized protein n=1 Tax=Plakobranchus ocellatus TaxID=259542 RepID=A0AAV4BY99_9GAST|nr:hypothetical protein PoB_005064000 [Plakobranchus ocellatus]
MASAKHILLVLAVAASLIPFAEAQLPEVVCTILEFSINLLLGCPDDSNFFCTIVTIMLNAIGCSSTTPVGCI